MNLLRRLLRGLQGSFTRSRRLAELDEEIRFHVETSTERYRAQGLPADEARRRALSDFGGVDAAREGVRDAWLFSPFSELARDGFLAVRSFRRRFSYAATVVLTVALAIGAAGTVFHALWAVLFRPLPFADDTRLAVLSYTQKDAGEIGLSPPELVDYREASRSLSGVAEYHDMNFTLLGHGEPRRVRTGVVSAGYFGMLGVRPIAGRDFVAADDSPSARPVILLSYRFWRDELGGDLALVGADFTMNDKVHTVIGILPPLPPAPDENDVYMPVSACPFRAMEHWAHSRTARGLTTLVRLADGQTIESASAELAAVTARLAKSYPEAYPAALDLRPRLVPLRDSMTANARRTLWLLGAAATTVLLLVCSNLLNLTLAQLGRREAELAVRAALGASRGRVVRQLATEACVLTLCGGLLGILFGLACRGLLTRFLGQLTPRASEIGLDATGIGIILVLALGLGLVLGIGPLLRRTGSLVGSLRSDGPTATAGGGRTRARDALVVLQVASSFMLLAGAGLLLRSLWNLERVPTGFRNAEVLTLQLPANWTKYADDASRLAYAERLLARTRELPGVESVALADNYPLSSNLPWNRRVAIGTQAPDDQTPGPTADFRTVSPGYFDTVGVPLLSGRPLNDSDRDPDHAVALVNAEFARRIFPDRDPLGQRVIFANGTIPWTIVGVVADVRQRGIEVPPEPEIYAPMALRGGAGVMLVRANAPQSLLPALRRLIRAVDPDQPIAAVRTLAEARAAALAAPRATAALLAIAAVLALIIAAAGLAGLLAFSLGQRRREFGIRLALGATRGDIARLVLGRTGGLVCGGVVLGLGGALLATRGLGSMLHGIAASDPRTYAAVALMLLASAFAACLPALRRAVGTAPSTALRAL